MTSWFVAWYEQLATNYRILLENPSACPAVGFLQLLTALLAVVFVVRAAVHVICVLLLRLGHRRFGMASDSRFADVYRRCCRTAGLKSEPRVYEIPDHGSAAFSTGLLRGDIFVSPELIEALDDDELESMLTHELIHVRRLDHLRILAWELAAALLPALAVQLFALRFVFSDTASWTTVIAVVAGWLVLRILLSGRLREWRERACDDRTIEVTGKPLALASALLKSWRRAAAGDRSRLPAAAALSYFARREPVVERRISRLLEYRRPALRLMFGRWLEWSAAAALVSGLLFLGSIHLSGRADAEIAVACTLKGEQTFVLIR